MASALAACCPGGAFWTPCALAGIGYHTSPFLAILHCANPATGQELGRAVLDTTKPGAVFVVPSPDPSVAEPWG